MGIHTDKKVIAELLSRGVEKVVNKERLEKQLSSGEKLRIKLGIDPTSPNIHLGRASLLLKLKAFQDLGHTIIFIVGDFTGVVGDTSDKESERPMLSRSDIKKNMKTYIDQAMKVLNKKNIEIHYNSKWLSKLRFEEILEQANIFSLSDFISRENINKRIESGKRVSLRETLYPLMQGYDSVSVKADVEIGGTDQWFNLLAGRTLQSFYKQEPQDILTTNLLPGLDGRKMSSSWGNTINLNDTPADMYGKVMSLKDDLIIPYFISCTTISLEEVEKIKKEIGKTLHPKEAKMKLAREIVSLFCNWEEAEKAEQQFISLFQKKETSSSLAKTKIKKGTLLGDALLSSGVISSKSEFRRLLESGAIKEFPSGEKIEDPQFPILRNMDIRVGKKKTISFEI